MKKKMTVKEILATNTKGKSLSDLLGMLGSLEDAEAVWQLRHRHEEDTGIPMEEDDIGRGDAEMYGEMFGEIEKKLKKVEKED